MDTQNEDRSNVMNNLANHYRTNKDHKNMIKYYLMAIDLKNYSAAYNLATYYEEVHDFDSMVKYCLIAIELGSSAAAYYVATYYEVIVKDMNNMVKYYLLAIKMGDVKSIYIMIDYYKKWNNVDKMIELYHIIIKMGDSRYMYKLGKYYEGKEDYENMIKYYKMAIDKKYDDKSLRRLIQYYAKIKKYDDMMDLVVEVQGKDKDNLNYAIFVSKSYDLYVKHKADLNVANLKVLKFISSLEKASSLCKICYKGEAFSLPCFKKHRLCGDCIVAMKVCPYCKVRFI